MAPSLVAVEQTTASDPGLTTATGAPPAPATTPVKETAGVECLHCGTQYDPLASRWLCPGCKQKTVTCCEGAPLPSCGVPALPVD